VIKVKHTYILLIVAISFFACKQTKYVPEGKYLLKKNKIIHKKDQLDDDELLAIVRQQPNYKSFGVKWKLMAYNTFDSTSIADKRVRKNIKLREVNKKKLLRQDKINERRIKKARKKGESFYTPKEIELKDTLEPRKFIREWYKYKIGRPPVVFDSILFEKSNEQLKAFIKRKGYYYGKVHSGVYYKINHKAIAIFTINAGKRYLIDSSYISTDNDSVRVSYQKFIDLSDKNKISSIPFDIDLLENHRYDVAKYMRNEGYYGFSKKHINFLVDTNNRDMTVTVGVQIGPRVIQSKDQKDSLITIPQKKVHIKKVYIHIADTTYFVGNFKHKVDELGMSVFDGHFIRTLDSTEFTIKNKKTHEIDSSRSVLVYHNGVLQVKARVLENQNNLEVGDMYSEQLLEQTYLNYLRLGMFQGVKTNLIEVEDGLIAQYRLVPTKKQTFGFEPRATNSNGFLGVAASVNYVNRNIFKGAEQLTISVSGGFESQPPIFDKTVDGQKIQTAARSFNTFEIGPSAKLEIPGLFPLKNARITKKLRPKTVISVSYNYQNRNDFKRGTFQMGYTYQFRFKKTMIFKLGLPAASVIKYVNISKSAEFEKRLNDLNDLFLLNAYSSQFIWQDARFVFEYNVKEKDRRKRNHQLYFKSSFDPAGNILSAFSSIQDTNANGQREFVGVPYSQFIRLDNILIISNPFHKKQSLNYKLQIGGGVPYGNTTTSLPYDYSFFGGGANDNRGWRARSLGPGSYKYYLDTNRTATQIGDIRLGASLEYRFPITQLVKGAIFMDAGNIWTYYDDPNRQGGQFSNSWYKEIAIAAGVGIRLDLDYLIIRLDMGIPLRNPALPDHAKWIFQSRQAYYDEGLAKFGAGYESILPLPFIPALHFGIGYPF